MSRVLIVGGGGVFGVRLAEGLRFTTGAHLLLAGRSLARAQAATLKIGCGEAVVLDRTRADAAAVRALAPDLVIDAAGPFQGGDLSFAKAVIEAGAHYIDLADARDFVAAFPGLDAEAKAQGVVAVAGASSTPALTQAVLDELCTGWRRIDVIRAGIAPGNQAPRGLSVVKAILSWAGAPVRVFEDGVWRERRGWSDCGAFHMAGFGSRRFALADTPDLDFIPARFQPADAALFMASLELAPLHRGLETVGALRGLGLLREPARFAELFRRAGAMLLPFGSDKGAMFVEALGRDGEDRPIRACWTMIAPAGLGPYTPTFPALVLARRLLAGDAPGPGAYPCVGLVRLAEIEPEFARHGFTTRRETELLTAPFEAALAARYQEAPAAVRAAHRAGPVTRLKGLAQVRGAATPATRLIARLFGFPGAVSAVPVSVTMRLGAGGEEIWERDFAGERLKSRLACVRPGVVRESFGPFSFDMKLDASARELSMEVIGWRLGPMPMPRFLAPRSRALERQDADGRFRFDVPIALPLIGRLVHYSGYLLAAQLEAAPASAEKEDA